MEQLIEEKLFTEFPPVSTQEWEKKIFEDLKGNDYEKKLMWQTQEGFKVKPYYRAEDIEGIEYLNAGPAEFPFIRGGKNKTSNEWERRQDIHVKNITESNKKALHLLENGVNALGFRITSLEIDEQEKFSFLLYNIPFNGASLHFLAGSDSPALFEYLLEETKKRNADTNTLTGSFDYDPVGNLTRTGNFYSAEKEDFVILQKFIQKAEGKLSRIKLIAVDGSVFRNAGSSAVQELAFTLSMAVEYLHRLTDEGLSADEVASRMHFTFGIGTNYFIEIAKLRAARYLWAKIVENYHVKNKDNAKMHIHSVTTGWNKTIYDPYVNILRTTTESMSAILGGTDSLLVNPFDLPYAGETEMSVRLARNTQIILKEEAYFDKVIDPAAGSYYIENLTDNIAEHAWKLFLETEEKGGYVQAFKDGFIQGLIDQTASQRAKLISTRREVLLGTNQYPNLNEPAKKRVNQQEVEKTDHSKIAEPLRIFRGSEEFEKLRLQTETAGRKRPKVFMLTIGNPVMRKARSTFSCNFFACAGYEVIDRNGFSSVDEGIKAAFNEKADIIVLCSSDEEYADYAPEALNRINEKAILVVAGEPACKSDLEAKGIRNFISLRTNVLENLKYYHELLGIKRITEILI